MLCVCVFLFVTPLVDNGTQLMIFLHSIYRSTLWSLMDLKGLFHRVIGMFNDSGWAEKVSHR